MAHGLHKASITILGILSCEVFDTILVIVSFVVDVAILRVLTHFKLQDALLILSFLLPWRVIRVVNRFRNTFFYGGFIRQRFTFLEVARRVNSNDEDSANFQESVTRSRSKLSFNDRMFYTTPRTSIQSDPGHGVLSLPKRSFAAQKRVPFDHMRIRQPLTHQTSVCSEYSDAAQTVETQNDNNITDLTNPVKFYIV
ncbi:hypothetical protein DPMN_047254 [Dreissena polymorpha]|uniref:Voltage-gated hydrogen channel 1 n=1 Tax=Dreissena polymorpha TaxID=45954 RepID=A0A9D4D7Q4_DREPO|nr:hypothetical protein DPMN_047254 [Dreissena polymorpha]